MNTYETVFITIPTLTEDEERSAVDAFSAVVTDRGGTLYIAERMGRRRLAYPISKVDDGVYTRLLYDSETEVPKEIERRLCLSDKVLRSLTVRLDREWAQDAKEESVRIKERIIEDAERAKREEAEREEAERRAAEAGLAYSPPAPERPAAPRLDEVVDQEDDEEAPVEEDAYSDSDRD